MIVQTNMTLSYTRIKGDEKKRKYTYNTVVSNQART